MSKMYLDTRYKILLKYLNTYQDTCIQDNSQHCFTEHMNFSYFVKKNAVCEQSEHSRNQLCFDEHE